MYDYRTDPVVAETAAAVRALYGERLKNLLLYGSRARGDVHEESDYDYLVMLDDEVDLGAARDELSDLSLKLFDSSGADVFFLPTGPNALEKAHDLYVERASGRGTGLMPESEDQIAAGTAKLERAMLLLRDGYNDEALRAAYFAGLAAVRAVLFEMLQMSTKTHRGARTAYLRLINDRPDLALPDRSFLQRAFDAKQHFDYAEPDVVRITAEEAIALAREYLDAAKRILAERA